ncbi:MAG: P1 family peptidase [Clostridia bacterium]|nr:P1 family peptidase [Clostridia bacterium]
MRKQKRIRDYGIIVGTGKTGERNKISDVPGVTVGHCTIRTEGHRTGVTVIHPCEDNMFRSKLVAASYVMNGFGKTVGLVQVDELGTLETPIALTNTLNVGRVSDALIEYMRQWCERENVPLRSINPVVGECNDAGMNRIGERVIGLEQVMQAIHERTPDFEEGNVGAGTGTICHGLKGGIGSASRVMEIGGQRYTIGVLVQSNHGCLERLQIGPRMIGQEILAARGRAEKESDQGSVMMIVATDLPVTDRQLRRIIRRCAAGLAHLGSYFGHGSGDVMIGFSTANRVPSPLIPCLLSCQMVSESALERAFEWTAEATEEAVLNSLVCAEEDVRLNGEHVFSLSTYLGNEQDGGKA